MARGNEYLAGILAKGVDRGAFTCSNVAAAASALKTANQGYSILAATAPNLIPKGSTAQSVQKDSPGASH